MIIQAWFKNRTNEFLQQSTLKIFIPAYYDLNSIVIIRYGLSTQMHRLCCSFHTLLDGSWPASLQGMWCVCVGRESRFKHIIPHLFTCYQSHTFSHLLSTRIALFTAPFPLSPRTPPLVVAFTPVIVFRAYKCSIFLPPGQMPLPATTQISICKWVSLPGHEFPHRIGETIRATTTMIAWRKNNTNQEQKSDDIGKEIYRAHHQFPNCRSVSSNGI